ncbi:MAG TPA: Nif3-like dinuclear metal center hexameric protein [Syntrophomonadaceae bacterium]|nr:Nif3-like dinuclear metal center hexameric protein [Syntrophomonadaceae bacterium]
MSVTVKDLTSIMEEYFPLHLAEEWDNSGLQVGDLNQSVQRVGLALDPSPKIIEKACHAGVELLITHHPLLFSPVKKVDFTSTTGKLIKQLIESGITLYSAHTNLDIAEQGLNFYLAKQLDLQEIQPLPSSRHELLYKLVVYVPVTHEEQVRRAVNQAGAGHIGAYRDCSFRVPGTGTFRPLAGTKPFLGRINELEEVEEFRLETILPHKLVPQVLKAMKAAHPYEEVAYDLYALANRGSDLAPGRSGILPELMKLEELAQHVKSRLGLDSVKVVGDLERKVNRVAVISGSGASFIEAVYRQGIQVLITGDVKYHEACFARDIGLAIIDAGHQGTEEVAVELLATLLQAEAQTRGLIIRIISLYEEICLKNI